MPAFPSPAADATAVVHTCGLTLSPVKHASHDILLSIQHQCDCAPVSMGEYVASPRVLAGGAAFASESDPLLALRVESDDLELAKQLQAEPRPASETMSVWGSMFTLTNTILGSGTLAVPFAIASSGWLLGNAVMLAIALVTRYSVHLLLSASDMAGDKCARTYESLGHFTLGTLGTALAEFTFIFGGFGTLVSYLIFVTDLIAAVAGVDASFKWVVSLLCAMGVVLPLALSRRLGKLWLASVLGIVSIAYVAAFVLFAALWTHQELDFSRVQAVRLEPGSIYTVTLLIGAFACHNTALPVYDELRHRSLPRMDRAVVGAIGVAFVLYEMIGLAGYLQFGAETRDNVLLNFSPAFLARHRGLYYPLLVGQTCMAAALLLTAPVAMWPFRSCVLSVYLRVKNGGQQTPSHLATPAEFSVATVVPLALILLCSVFVPSVKIPLSIVGSVSGSLLIFILPALFFLLLAPAPMLSRQHAGPLLMLAVGVVVGVVGLSLTLYKIARDHF